MRHDTRHARHYYTRQKNTLARFVADCLVKNTYRATTPYRRAYANRYRTHARSYGLPHGFVIRCLHISSQTQRGAGKWHEGLWRHAPTHRRTDTSINTDIGVCAKAPACFKGGLPLTRSVHLIYCAASGLSFSLLAAVYLAASHASAAAAGLCKRGSAALIAALRCYLFLRPFLCRSLAASGRRPADQRVRVEMNEK